MKEILFLEPVFKEVIWGGNKLSTSYGYKIPSDTTGECWAVSAHKNGDCKLINGEFKGSIVISDKIKENADEALINLKAAGVKKTVMLTGDNKKTAEKVGEKVNIDEVHSELLPLGKVKEVEKLLKASNKNGRLAFVGDGVNDAPVLARADIGIAMGGIGSDAAIEAADVVLMKDDINALVDAINVSKKTNKILWQNIIFALGVKVIIMVLGTFGIANMWTAVFADVGVTIIAIINSTRCFR